MRCYNLIRCLATASHIFALCSAAIATGLTSWSLARDNNQLFHILYQEVVAITTFFFYLSGILFPFLESYSGYLAPFNIFWSILWLVSFIFSVEDRGGNSCQDDQYGRSRCAIRHTIIAFNFLTLIALLSYAVTEIVHWRVHMMQKADKSRVPETDEQIGDDKGATAEPV